MSLLLLDLCQLPWSSLGALGRVILHLSPPLVSRSGCSGPHAFTFAPHLSPTLVSRSGRFGPHDFPLVSHLSPALVSHTSLPLWVLWAGWFYTLVSHSFSSLDALSRMTLYTCLPLVSHSGCWAAWFYTCLSFVFRSGRFGPWAAWFYTCLPPPACSPNRFTCMGFSLLWRVASLSGRFRPLVSHWVLWAAWFHTCLPLVSRTCFPLWAHWAAWLYTCFPLVSHTCLPFWVLWATWFHTCLPLVSRTCFPRFYTCPPLVSHTSLPLRALWAFGPHDFTLVSHPGCSGPHDFTLVSHLSPILVFHSACSGPRAFQTFFLTCLPLAPRSGCSGRHDFIFVYSLSAACFPLVPHACLPLWALWGRMILRCMILHLSPTERETGVGGKSETNVKAFGPERPEWETSGKQAQDKCIKSMRPRAEWKTSAGDKCKSMRPRAPRGGDKLRALWAACFYMCPPLVSRASFVSFWLRWATCF